MTNSRGSDEQACSQDHGLSALAQEVGELRSDVQSLSDNHELTAEINRKMGVLLQNLNDRIMVIEATMNATVFKHIFTPDVSLEDIVADDRDQISFAEAMNISRQNQPGQLDVQSMPDEDGMIYRYKLPGNRSARVKTDKSGEIVGQPFIDEPNGERSEMTNDEANGLLAATFGMIRKSPTGSDRDDNFDHRVMRGL